MEAARRDSLAEDEANRMRASELAAGASSSHTVEIERGTTDGVDVAETPLRVSRLQRTWNPGNQTHQLIDRRRFAPQVCFTYHSSI